MDPTTAFPITMASAPSHAVARAPQLIRHGSYALRPALGPRPGGMPAVLAGRVHRQVDVAGHGPILVVLVVGYTAVTLLRAATREQVGGKSEDAPDRRRPRGETRWKPALRHQVR